MTARNHMSRRTRAAGLPFALIVVGLLAICSTAMGAPGYVPATPASFGGLGSGPGQLKEPAGVAVNEATGDVYVYDAGNRRVQWFSAGGAKVEGQLAGAPPTGAFAPPATPPHSGTLFNLAIDNDLSSPSHGDVYVVDPGHNAVDKFTAAGAYLSQLSSFANAIEGIAVDRSGHVWVEESNEEIREFDDAAANVLLTSVAAEHTGSPGLAVDSEEHLYGLREEPNVIKFTDSGTILVSQLTTCGCDTALAVDESATGAEVKDDLFTARGVSLEHSSVDVARYPVAEAATRPLEIIEGVAASTGIAVDGATNELYVTQGASGTVAAFELVPLPDVTTLSANEVTRTSAKLEGEVNPKAVEVTSCEFEYGETDSYGHTERCSHGPGSGSSPLTVSAEITGLTAQRVYHYRLSVGNVHGSRHGADQTFTTSVAVEGVSTDEAIAVTGTTATLNGSLDPNEIDTHYFFEYGTSASYGHTTAPQDAGAAKGTVPVSEPATGLIPEDEYHYRLVGENSFGTTQGGESTFLTARVPPEIVGPPVASGVTSQTADLFATLNPEHAPTSYHFEYGPCPTLAGCPTVLDSSAGSSSIYGVAGASEEVTELRAATTYSFRLVASNEAELGGKQVGGKATGAEGVFTTSPAPAVAAITGPASAVTATSAIAAGTVEPGGAPATYRFELGVYDGTGTTYGTIASGSVPASHTPVPENTVLSGLQPGGTYAYRIAIQSGYGEAMGAPVVFTTEGLPAVLTSPSTPSLLGTPAVGFPVEVPSTGKAPARPKCKKGVRHACVKKKKHRVRKKRSVRRR